MLLITGALLLCSLPLSSDGPWPAVDESGAALLDEQWAWHSWSSLMQMHSPSLVRTAEHAANLSAGADDAGVDAPSEQEADGTTGDPLGQRLLQRLAEGGGGAAQADPALENFTALVLEAVTRTLAGSLDGASFGEIGSAPPNATGAPSAPKQAKRADQGMSFFNAAPPEDWLILFIVAVVLFLIDYFVIQRICTTPQSHGLAIVFWFFVAVGFNIWIWARFGRKLALDWCTGYFLEWILSMDNLFVFHLVFECYKTPAGQTHRAVFLGIIGAVVIRMVFFMLVSTLLTYIGWIRYPFGLLLVWSGIQAARGDDDDEDVSDTWLVQCLSWLLGGRLKNEYDPDARLFVWDANGKLQVTLLAMVVALLELSDVVFALDSVSAKIAQIPHTYIAFSSTVIAMYGLRAMFFVIKDLVEMFELLKYGLCLILVFIGIELMFEQFVHLPSGVVCILIVSVFITFTSASVIHKRVKDALTPRAETAIEDVPTALMKSSES